MTVQVVLGFCEHDCVGCSGALLFTNVRDESLLL